MWAPRPLPSPPPCKNGSSKRAVPRLAIFLSFRSFAPFPFSSLPKLRRDGTPHTPPPKTTSPDPAPAYQGVDGGAGSQAVGAGSAVAAAVRPRPREQAGAEGQQRAAESQQQRHGAARRRAQTAASSPPLPSPRAPIPAAASPSFGAGKGGTKRFGRRGLNPCPGSHATPVNHALFGAGVVALAR